MVLAAPGRWCRHEAEGASSYFDRLWKTGLSAHSATHDRYVLHVRTADKKGGDTHVAGGPAGEKGGEKGGKKGGEKGGEQGGALPDRMALAGPAPDGAEGGTKVKKKRKKGAAPTAAPGGAEGGAAGKKKRKRGAASTAASLSTPPDVKRTKRGL